MNTTPSNIFVFYHSNQSTSMYYMKGLYAKIAMCKKIKCTTLPYTSTVFQKEFGHIFGF